ncbi:MAG: membrane protein insertase YidC [Rickettsiales bacterium]|jgi:YidC/Oxa1 family membrane protein insertase|nr:membrane protein insertase YidC [Rickettsiales bacterium]
MKKKNNDDVRILVATLLSTFAIIVWMRWYGNKTLPTPIKEELVAKQVEKNVEPKKEEIKEIKKEEEIKNEKVVNKRVKINTPLLAGTINLQGLTFDDLTLNKYKKTLNDEEKIKLLNSHNESNAFYFSYNFAGEDTDFPTKNTIWKASGDLLEVGKSIIFTHTNKDKILFEVKVSIDENYMFNVEQTIKNNGKKTIIARTKNLLTKKHEGDAENTVHAGFVGAINNEVEEVKYAKFKKKDIHFDDVKWAGWTDKYWLVAITGDYSTNIYSQEDFFYTIEFRTKNKEIANGEEIKTISHIFTGAKVLKLLDEYVAKYDLPLFDRSVDFGWYYFLTKPMYSLLKVFYNFTGNFGMAIILLTLLIKSVLFPLSNKSYKSMAKIKLMQPKIDGIKKRYGDNKAMINKETVELYKKEKVNPLSGCLPMLIQIPILFSLYKVFSISIDMRQAPFFGYIKDLAAKDPTNIFNLFGLLPFQVSFLEIGFLPCLMALTTWLQQKMAGSSDNKAEMVTATKIMPFMFLFLFNGMPTGLLLYWVFNNTLSMVQQYIVEKLTKK